MGIFFQLQFKLLLGPFKFCFIFFVINLIDQLTWHASSHVCAWCHDFDCCSFLVVVLLLLVRRRRWDGRAFRLTFRGVRPVPGYWVCRQVFTHLNHCYWFFTCYIFFPLCILLALCYDACVSIPSHVTLQPWDNLTSTPLTLLFVGMCVFLACLLLFELESVVIHMLTCLVW